MISSTFETHRPAYWTSVTLCFVLLAALCCCNAVQHQKTDKMAVPLQSASAPCTMPDTSQQLGTAAIELSSLLDAGDGAVVTLVSGETRLAAHRSVLAGASAVFAAAFCPDKLKASISEVPIPDVEGPVLRQMLAFFYTGRAPQLPGKGPQLLAAAEKFGVSASKGSCDQLVAEQLSVENAAATALLAVKHRCHSLSQATATFIKNHLEVLGTDGWAEAVLNHPGDLVQFTRLLAEQPAETSEDGQTSFTAAPPTPYHHTEPSVAKAICSFRTLSAKERDKTLIQAAKRGSVPKVRALLAVGAYVGARDRKRSTALHRAAEGGHVEAVRCLLQAGAEVGAKDRLAWTPLHLAAESGHVAVVRLLQAASADPNAKTESVWTPLHRAADRGHAEVAAVLLQAGANRGALSQRGDTPLDLATRSNHQELIQMLQGNF